MSRVTDIKKLAVLVDKEQLRLSYGRPRAKPYYGREGPLYYEVVNVYVVSIILPIPDAISEAITDIPN